MAHFGDAFAFELGGAPSAADKVYAALRSAHSLLAYVLFATVVLHLSAALFHLWVRRDGVFQAMAKGKDG